MKSDKKRRRIGVLAVSFITLAQLAPLYASASQTIELPPNTSAFDLQNPAYQRSHLERGAPFQQLPSAWQQSERINNQLEQDAVLSKEEPVLVAPISPELGDQNETDATEQKQNVPAAAHNPRAVTVDGTWTKITKQEWARWHLSDDLDLFYGFGPNQFSEGSYTSATDTITNPDNTVQGSDEPQYSIPNVILYDKKAEKVVTHLYNSDGLGGLTLPLNSTLGYFATVGDSGAANNTTGSMFKAEPPYNLDRSGGYTYYKKKLDNGMMSYKIVFESKIDDFVHEETPQIIPIYLDVEITMTGQTNGSVLVEGTFTNTGTNTLKYFTMGAAIDTALAGDDAVSVLAIGDNEGMYIVDKEEKYRLDYKMKIDTGHGPVNWASSILAANIGDFFNDEPSTNPEYLQHPFATLASTGHEADNPAKGTILMKNNEMGRVDTSMNMKQQPIPSFAPGASQKLDYVIGLRANTDPPVISLDQAPGPGVYPGGDYTISGQWSDTDSDSVDLYYRLDNGTEVKFAGPVTQGGQDYGKKHAYTFDIPADKLGALDPSMSHTITVYAKDKEGYASNEVSVTLTFGSLKLVTAPEVLDFGTNPLAVTEKIYNPTKDQALVVKDTRGNGKKWRMDMKLTADLTSTPLGAKLENALYYQKDASTRMPLPLGTLVTIHNETTSSSSDVDISANWSKDIGPLLIVKPGVAKAENYEASITWTLADVPENE